MKNEVGFQPIGKRVEIESGTTILETAQQAGVGLSAICGGEGSCDAYRIRLVEGYEECYSKLFSHGSIWRRRPEDLRAVPSYLAMSYLYKKSNRLWALLIRRRWTARVWRPLVELSRRRHLRFRKRLIRSPNPGSGTRRAEAVVSAGV